jgi:hypothetical protein
MSNLWDKQDKETARSYAAFCDYRDMGTGRSLRALHEQYSSTFPTKPPTLKENTLFTWSTKNEWQRRVLAWDNEQTRLQTKEFELARTQIIEDELRDYRLQLAKWESVFKATPLHESQHRTTKDGVTTEFVKIKLSALHQLTRWRDDITKQGRRALGMPEKVTEQKVVTWQDQALEDIRAGTVKYQDLVEATDYDFATDLFARAGVQVQVRETEE